MGRLVAFAGFRHDHQPLAAACRIVAGKHRHTPFADTRQLADRLFQIVGIQIAAAALDQVLDAPGDKHFAFGHVRIIARIEPAGVKQLGRRLRIAVVTGCRGRPAELQPSDTAFRQFVLGFIDDPDLMPGQCVSARRDRQGFGTGIWGSGGRQRLALARKRIVQDQIDARPPPRWRDSESDRGLGQSVHRRDGLRAQAAGGKAGRERCQRGGTDRFGAVERQPPCRQVQLRQRGVVDVAHAQIKGKVRRRRDGAAVARNHLQPEHRPRQKGQRRHQHQWNAMVQRAEPCADQAHVVVQRQPGHEHVVGRDLRCLPQRPDVGQQVGMREYHPLRIAGAAGRVLQKGDVIRLRAVVRRSRCVGGLGGQFLRRDDGGQTRYCRLQHAGHRLGLRHGDDEHRFGIGQDVRMPFQMVFDLRQPCRRIDRHRNPACHHHAEKAGQIIASGRQHQCHALPWLQSVRGQAGGDRACRVEQIAVADRVFVMLLVMQQYVDPLRLVRDVPFQHVEQGLRAVGHAGRAGIGQCAGELRRLFLHSLSEKAQQIARGLGFRQRFDRQFNAERLSHAQHQFGPRQAVERQVFLERGMQRDLMGATRMRVIGQLPHHRQQAFGARGGRPSASGGCRFSHGNFCRNSCATRMCGWCCAIPIFHCSPDLPQLIPAYVQAGSPDLTVVKRRQFFRNRMFEHLSRRGSGNRCFFMSNGRCLLISLLALQKLIQ